MSFFVMLVAFSTQDKQKLQIVAGSMRDAFGVQQVRFNGIIEIDGSPTKAVAQERPRGSTRSTLDQHARARTIRKMQKEGIQAKEDRSFALAAADAAPGDAGHAEISELSKHIMIEETATGLNIELVDQDGRSMFPDGAKDPYDRTRRIVQKLAGPLKALPNRVSITGHTAASRLPPRPGYGPWELSADRANAVRQILEDEGMRPPTSSWWAARPTASRCSPTTRKSPPTAASPSP
jgi:chemotaxis protein MotB